MTRATREALARVLKILQEAGWDQPENPHGPIGGERMSHLFDDMTDEEQAALLLVGMERLSHAEVARRAGLAEEEVVRLYESACLKLRERAIESLRKSKEVCAG